MGFGVEAEKGCRDLVRAGCGFFLVARHLPFACTGQTVGIDGKQAALKVSAGTPEATQGKLKLFGLLKGMSQKQIMNALIRDNKGKPVEKFETLLTESSGRTNVHHSQSGFVNHLHSHAGGKIRGRSPGPACQQIPCSQAQMLGSQEPKADEVA